MKKITLALGVLAFGWLSAQTTPPPAPATTSNESKIEGVTIVKTKKAVEQKADRTIFDFSEQPQLNTGSALEGIKKLPGMIVSDVAGMLYQGKLLEVYMDAKPLGINGNQLQAFLEGLPANSIERVEVVTQPGAEFPATNGGAIINIITSRTARSYLTATYSGKYAFSNYDKFRNRVNNSLLLNAKNSLFAWQLNFGQNYRENYRDNFVDDISRILADNVQRGYFLKAGMTFDVGQDRLLLNYDLNVNNNDAYSQSNGFRGIANPLTNAITEIQDFNTLDFGKTKNTRHEASATYQVKFDDRSKKLDIQLDYSDFKNTYGQNSQIFLGNNTTSPLVYETTSDQKLYYGKVDFSQPLNIFDGGKFSAGGLYEKLDYETALGGLTNLDYQRQTASSYAEMQATVKKFDIVLGARAESYDISGISRKMAGNTIAETAIIPFRQTRIFPNASIQYNFMPRVSFILNYNKKIQLPNISWLNPNNTNYQGGNITFGGNVNLQPAIFDNFEAKFSIFDYAFVGYNLSVVNNESFQVAERAYFNPNQPIIGGREAYGVRQTFVNIPNMRIHNVNIGVPLPLMIFTKGLKETMKFNFNPDKINFFYIYTGYQLHEIPDFDTKGFWIFNIMGQFILPGDMKLVANYMNMTTGGNYYYYYMDKSWMNSLDITLTKKFLKDRLTVSVFANDIFRWNQNAVRSAYNNANISLGSRFDSQNFGLSVNYKIPTRNKLAKEEQNILTTDKPEPTTSLPTPQP